MKMKSTGHEYHLKWRTDHKEHMKEYHRQWRKDHPTYYNEYMKRWKERKNLRDRIYMQRRKISIRKQIFELLGNKCSNSECLVPGGCTDIRCLQIDHINGGGAKELKRFSGSVSSMMNYYLKHESNIKEKLQILCANCNWIKRHTNNELKRH